MMSSKKKTRKKKNNPVIDVEIELVFKSKIKVIDEEEFYDKTTLKEIQKIVNHFSKNVFIDKTYVCFNGNRWKDAFIKEEGWKELMSLLAETNYGEIDNEDITVSLLAITHAYIFDILEHMGYDVKPLQLNFGKSVNFMSRYSEDKRTDWRF